MIKSKINAALFLSSALGLVIAVHVNAASVFRIDMSSKSSTPATIPPVETWSPTTPLVTEWLNVGGVYNCGAFTPDPATQPINSTFLQTRPCHQDQNRSVTSREINSLTSEIRELSTEVESRTYPVQDPQNAIGTLKTWAPAAPRYTEWTKYGMLQNGKYSPTYENFPLVPFEWTYSGDQNYRRYRFEQECETSTNECRDAGGGILESKKEFTVEESHWVTVTIGSWNPQSTIWGAYSPLPSEVAKGVSFEQTRTGQTRTVRTLIYKTATSTIHNGAEWVYGTTTSTQMAVGTKE